LTVSENGCFLGLREHKKSLEEIFDEIWPLARNQSSDHRNLDEIYTDVFWGLRERKKSLKEIFNKNLWQGWL